MMNMPGYHRYGRGYMHGQGPKTERMKNSNVKRVAWIDQEKCIKCMKCVSICPESAINGTKKHVEVIEERCKGCGDCIRTCPVQAISMRSIEKAQVSYSENAPDLIERKRIIEARISTIDGLLKKLK